MYLFLPSFHPPTHLCIQITHQTTYSTSQLLASMHYLRVFPYIRLLLLFYLCLLHVYVFGLVGWHAGQIEVVHSDVGGSFHEGGGEGGGV